MADAIAEKEEDIVSIRMENRLRARDLLEQNLRRLQHLCQFTSLSEDCLSDLCVQLQEAMDSAPFLTRLGSLHQASSDEASNTFPLDEAIGADFQSAESDLIVDLEESNSLELVKHKNISTGGEEMSEIDDEGYVTVDEEFSVDGIANFIARCILSNPQAQGLTLKELQEKVAKSLVRMKEFGKIIKLWHTVNIIYTVPTWGLALACVAGCITVVRT